MNSETLTVERESKPDRKKKLAFKAIDNGLAAKALHRIEGEGRGGKSPKPTDVMHNFVILMHNLSEICEFFFLCSTLSLLMAKLLFGSNALSKILIRMIRDANVIK